MDFLVKNSNRCKFIASSPCPDNIDVGYGGEMIMGAKAASDGVATGIIFVCGEEGAAVVL